MMTSTHDNTDELLKRAKNGELAALDELFRRNRTRLRRAVQLRIDRRLSSRVDPSDVIQESLLDAAQAFQKFIRERPLPFYPWLRQVTLDRLKKIHRFHLQTQQRALEREKHVEPQDASGTQLVDFLATQSVTPSQAAQVEEQRKLLEVAVAQLPDTDREILVMRYLEEMSSSDAAAVLGISLNVYAQRHVRAVRRLRKIMAE